MMEINQKQEQKPVYIHQFPFRFVQPYPYTYKTFTKGRWIGKALLPTLIKQFKAYPPQYYEKSIANGKIKVNNKQVDPQYILKNGDQIVHVSIRVEPPVLDLPIQIVDETDDFVVINKPPSIIVHTGGGHHFNTIENLLKFQHHFKHLHILHRLDKCTSGLLLFAKDKQKVALFHQQSEKQIMKKMYYARVGGNFSWEEKTLKALIECISHKDGVYRVTKQIDAEEEEVEQKYVEKLDKKEGVQKVEKIQKVNKYEKNDFKDSKTLFKKVWYDQATDSSLLECYPITGRTHQIRVHLQFLGFPILNDVVYDGRFVGNKVIDHIAKPEVEKEQPEGVPIKKMKMSQGLRPEDWDYETKPWQIMLHSFKYKFGGKQFKTKVPYWFFKENLSVKELTKVI